MKIKKSGYWHRQWKERARRWREAAELLQKHGQIDRAVIYQKRADEYSRRATAADPKAV